MLGAEGNQRDGHVKINGFEERDKPEDEGVLQTLAQATVWVL